MAVETGDGKVERLKTILDTLVQVVAFREASHQNNSLTAEQ